MSRHDQKPSEAGRVAGASVPRPLRETTLLPPKAKGIDPWQAAQLESVFRAGEEWGTSLDHLVKNTEKA
jgi:hypothetical protein